MYTLWSRSSKWNHITKNLYQKVILTIQGLRNSVHGAYHTGYFKFHCDSVKHKVISVNHSEPCRISYENASRTGLRNLCNKYHNTILDIGQLNCFIGFGFDARQCLCIYKHTDTVLVPALTLRQSMLTNVQVLGLFNMSHKAIFQGVSLYAFVHRPHSPQVQKHRYHAHIEMWRCWLTSVHLKHSLEKSMMGNMGRSINSIDVTFKAVSESTVIWTIFTFLELV